MITLNLQSTIDATATNVIIDDGMVIGYQDDLCDVTTRRWLNHQDQYVFNPEDWTEPATEWPTLDELLEEESSTADYVDYVEFMTHNWFS